MKIIFQNLFNYSTPEGFRGRSVVYVQLWWIVQALLFNTSPQFAYSYRRFLLRAFGAKIGSNVLIRSSVKVTYPWKLEIGDFSWVGDDVVLYNLGEIKIGQNSVVSQRSYLCTGSHDYQSSSFDIYEEPIVIQDEAWVATDVFISPGVTIGKGAVIGARSSVFEDMPPEMICLGNPAKAVKNRVMKS